MGAEYNSQKQDGYLNKRNEVYQQRERQMQQRTAEEQAAVRPVSMTNQNYGYKPAK